MKQAFKKITLSRKSRAFLETINDIIVSYQEQGYTLTLRQLYYQLVSRDLIANNTKEYAKLSRVLSEARMSGMVDWNAIEDRDRVAKRGPAWDSPKDILRGAAEQFALDKLEGQDTLIEVWVEKNALSEVVNRIASKYHVRTLVNRGYGSVSAMYDSYQRFKHEESIRVLYLGDHDPSGLDMIRDIQTRVSFMLGDDVDFKVVPVALTMKQIKQYNPPPNPAKISDSRAENYIAKWGKMSWEVDALEPSVLTTLIETNIMNYIDMDKFNVIRDQEKVYKSQLKKIAEDFE